MRQKPHDDWESHRQQSADKHNLTLEELGLVPGRDSSGCRQRGMPSALLQRLAVRAELVYDSSDRQSCSSVSREGCMAYPFRQVTRAGPRATASLWRAAGVASTGKHAEVGLCSMYTAQKQAFAAPPTNAGSRSLQHMAEVQGGL